MMEVRNLKYLRGIIVIIALVILVSCNKNTDEDKKLITFEVKDGLYTPQEGLTITEAKDLTIDELVNIGVKGDIKKAAIIEEITTQEI